MPRWVPLQSVFKAAMPTPNHAEKKSVSSTPQSGVTRRIVCVDGPLPLDRREDSVEESLDDAPPSFSFPAAQSTVGPGAAADACTDSERSRSCSSDSREQEFEVDRSVMSGILDFVMEGNLLHRSSTLKTGTDWVPVTPRGVEESDDQAVERDLHDVADAISEMMSKYPDAGSTHWTCEHCDEPNRKTRSLCNNCNRARYEDGDSQNAAKTDAPEKDSRGETASTTSEGSSQYMDAPTSREDTPKMQHSEADEVTPLACKSHWTCRLCDDLNRPSRTRCNNCDCPKDSGAEKGDSPEVPVSPYESPWPFTERTRARQKYETPWQLTPGQEKSTSSTDPGDSSRKSSRHDDDVPKEKVILHIYDVFADERVQAVNDVFRAVGSGAFHAGVEVFGQEWSYGYSPYHSGLVFCDPAGNPAHKYREAIVMGVTYLSKDLVDQLLSDMTTEWRGVDYDLLKHNCCHFCDNFCRRLGVGPLPEWVLNLAGAGANLIAGISGAALAVNQIADAAAEHAAELDKKFNILGTVDSFTNREITIDDTYLESKVQNLWTQASEGWKNIENVGLQAGKALGEVQKADSVKKVEARISSTLGQWFGSWGPQAAPESCSKAVAEEQGPPDREHSV